VSEDEARGEVNELRNRAAGEVVVAELESLLSDVAEMLRVGVERADSLLALPLWVDGDPSDKLVDLLVV